MYSLKKYIDMKSIIIKILITLLAGISISTFTSCEGVEKEIDWKVTDTESRLIVEGSFTDQKKIHSLYLKQSAQYFANKKLAGVQRATVTISDGTQNWQYIESATQAGLYLTKDSIAGTAGKTYTLKIKLESPLNGESNYSVVAEMKKTIQVDSIFAFVDKNPFYEKGNNDSTILTILSFGNEPVSVNDYYQFIILKNDTAIADTVNQYSVVNDLSYGINGRNNLTIVRLASFKDEDIVSLQIWSIEKQYFDFVEAIQNIKNNAGDPLGFSPPMANAIGNIKGGDALGYFLVSSVSEGVALVYRE